MKKFVFGILATLFAMPAFAGARDAARSAAKSAFQGSDEVTNLEDYYGDKFGEEFGYLASPEASVVTDICDDNDDCSFIVTVSMDVIGVNDHRLAVINGTYEVDTSGNNITNVTELSVN
ncbi:MAG: hypothetical protein AB7T49_11225 [Oligoflexales bacterium]